MTDVHLPTLHPELEALARRALKHLESLGYSESSLSYFELTWKRLCVFAQEQSLPDALSEDLLDQFLAHPGPLARFQMRDRLIHEQDGRFAHDGTPNAHALHLPAA